MERTQIQISEMVTLFLFFKEIDCWTYSMRITFLGTVGIKTQ